MDLTWTDEQEGFRAEARAWLEANVPHGLPSGDTRDGFAKHLEWERHLFDNRWAVVSWPEAYGGRDASLWEWLIFEEEYYRAGGPQRVTQNGIFLLAPTVFEFGTQAQKDHILPRMARGDDLWCQGWSEPNAGSDLAGIQSRAARDEARGWLEAHVPRGLPSGDTADGFALHLEWERALFDARYAVVSWPEAYGGRDATPMVSITASRSSFCSCTAAS